VIFGDKFGPVFHSVPSILPNSAPKKFLRDFGLFFGWLNLTFKQY